MNVTKLELYLDECLHLKHLIERSLFKQMKLQKQNKEKIKSLDELNLEQLILDLRGIETQLFFLIDLELKEQIRNANKLVDSIDKNNELDDNLENENSLNSLFDQIII